MPEPHVYRASERPDVEVLVDGYWYPGELRAWFPTADGWEGNVQYALTVSEDCLGTFPSDHIREGRNFQAGGRS